MPEKLILSTKLELPIIMANLAHVILFSAIGGVFSMTAALLLLSNKKTAKKLATYATPFAAGALLAAAFTDLLPEASHHGSVDTALQFTLVGIIGFFLLERFLRVFHHHHENEKEHHNDEAPASLIIIGDTLHNFIDGIAIAAGFLIDVQTGIVVTLAVAAHEIPQEIGDFGLLIKKGMKKASVIRVNLLSALASTVAAIIFFRLGESTDLPLDALLGLVAGMFIYIAVSDIIPTIHKAEDKVIAGPQTILLIVGLIGVGLVSSTLHDYIDQDDHNHSGDSHLHEDEGRHDEQEKDHHDEHDDHEDEEHHDEHDGEKEDEEHHEDEHHDEDEEHHDE